MKKWGTLLATLIICSFNNANASEDIQILSSKAILQNSEGYFALSDGTCWKVMSFSPRSRSLCEWWRSVQIVPESYQTTPADWLIGAQIEAYPIYGNIEVDIDNASNREILMECTHLLFNRTTNHILFAISMHPAYCLTEVFTDAHQDGYEKGFLDGRSQLLENTTGNSDRNDKKEEASEINF